ncbi:MAG: adenylyltransferase/cytidyltransferase family protein [Polyangiaceae bacterium]
MIRIFVSGCYDIIHAGHLQFFREARALGDHLTVSFASQEVLWKHKQRNSSLPDEHKQALLLALDPVDDVVIGRDDDLGLDFKSHFQRLRPSKLVVTEDDKYGALKRDLCAEVGAEYVVLPKTPPQFPPTSTSKIVRFIRAPQAVPLRVDFAGGWLDVPRYARPGAFIVNCAISPTVTLREWSYRRNSGLGGSGAWALLNGEDGVRSELDLGVGWQDPAVIAEGGLCVWSSGPKPELEIKTNGTMLQGRMALCWTGSEHSTPAAADRSRDYDAIEQASRVAREAVWANDFAALCRATSLSYAVQLAEGMSELPPLPDGAIARKYCGGGFGGYALFLFETPAARDSSVHARGLVAVEPFLWSR